jgi:hypothetical protein
MQQNPLLAKSPAPGSVVLAPTVSLVAVFNCVRTSHDIVAKSEIAKYLGLTKCNYN